MKKEVLALILGGGQGARLFPLTLHRSKPAVPLGGKYRLIDITVSNCINSGIHYIYVLTQFNSASLNRHIARTYRFSRFSDGFGAVFHGGNQILGSLVGVQLRQERDGVQTIFPFPNGSKRNKPIQSSLMTL